MKTSYRFLLFQLYEYPLLEEYINQKAINGWHIVWMNKGLPGLMKFEKKVEQASYMVDYYAYEKGKNEDERNKEYRSFVEEYGYEPIGCEKNGIQIYKKCKEDAMEIRVDDEANRESLRTTVWAMIRSIFATFIINFICIYTGYTSLRASFFVSDSDLFQILTMVTILIDELILTFPNIMWLLKEDRKAFMWKVYTRTILHSICLIGVIVFAYLWFGLLLVLLFLLFLICVLCYQRYSKALKQSKLTIQQARIRRFWAGMGVFLVMMASFWMVSIYKNHIHEQQGIQTLKENSLVKVWTMHQGQSDTYMVIQVKDTPIASFLHERITHYREVKQRALLDKVILYHFVEEYGNKDVLVESEAGYLYIHEQDLPKDTKDILKLIEDAKKV